MKNTILTILFSLSLLIVIAKHVRRPIITKPLQTRPVIGILTQPVYGDPNTQYIAASYVNWLESAGARSIAIPQNADNATIDAIFPHIHGVLLPGGADVNMQDSVRRLWELALKSNDEGEVFPVWASCLGFEMVVTLVGTNSKEEQKDFDILLKNYDSENIALPLDFTDQVSLSNLFANPHLRHMARTENITMNNHMNGIKPETFMSNKSLSKMFRIISTNVDRNNQPFVSTIEAKDYPIYGVQWHPEKTMFEYNTFDDGTDTPKEVIPHTADAVRLSFEMSMAFVDKARESTHTFVAQKESPFVWNYPRVKSESFQVKYLIDVSAWNDKDRSIVTSETHESFNEMQSDQDTASTFEN